MARTNPFRSHPLLTGLGLVLLALVVAFAICEWRGWPFLRQPLQRMLNNKLERRVEVGPAFKLHTLGSLRVRTDSLTIGAPRWSPPEAGKDFFGARDVFLQLPWSTLWNLAVTTRDEPLRISALEVGSFDTSLWRLPDGRANWDFSRPDTQAKKTGARIPEFERLVVLGGRLALDDAPTGLKMQAEATTDEGLAAGSHEAGLRIKGSGHYREGDFDFTMRSNGVLPLIAPEGATTAVPLTLQARSPHGRVHFEGQARDVIHLHDLSGTFSVSGSSLAAIAKPFRITLPTTSPFEMDGKLSKHGEVYRADVARFAVGNSRLHGAFTFDRRPQPPLLTGRLLGRNLDLADLGPAFGTSRKSGATKSTGQGGSRVLPTREFDIPSLKFMDASVQVDLQRADFHTPVLEAFAPLAGEVTLRGGVLTLGKLLARTSGGEVQGRIGLDGRDERKPRWDGDVRWSGVQLQRFIHMKDTHTRDAAQKEASGGNYVSGLLGGHLQFTGAGRSIASVASTLDGTLAAWINNGTVSHLAMEAAGIDIGQALGVLIKGDDALKMQCAASRFTMRDGTLYTDVGIIDTSDTTMLFGGQISLPDERLALVAQANPKDFSPLALRSPIHLDGTFSKPQVHLETKPIAARAVASLALASVNPLAALIPLVEPPKATDGGGCRQALARMRGDRGANGSRPVAAPDAAAKPGNTSRQPAAAKGRAEGDNPSAGDRPNVAAPQTGTVRH